MGRHRRSAAGGAATNRATEVAHPPAEAAPARGHRRRGRAVAPVKTGLLGASAAVAMGAIAVTSGVLPGGDLYSIGGSGPGKVRVDGSPSDLRTDGGTYGSAEETPSATPPTGSASPGSPSARTSSPGTRPSRQPSHKPSAEPTPGRTKTSETATGEPLKSEAPPPAADPSTPQAPSAESAAATQVLNLVNEQRSRAGCSPVTADPRLASLAQDFSEAMAAGGFFDHTDPQGRTPWDRAAAAGIKNLGGENIARGQADAQAVMDSWMNSPGHRANILNCDYKTLGVGVHIAEGGPWWTQDFGF